MTKQNQMTQAGGNRPVIMQYLEKHKDQIALALPKHLTADRMSRIVLTEISKNRSLLECSPKSFFGAVIQASQLGLEPGNAMGHCYLIPFNNRQAKTKDVQLIIGYRGMIDLARRSGQIVSITARVVYQGDTFSYQYGLNEDISHVPCDIAERGPITHFYAIAKLKDGGVQWEVMSKGDIDKVREQHSKAKNSPWESHYEEMGKKTVIRRLYKYLPVSIEIQSAVGLDEQADAGIDQGLGSVIDVTDDDYQVEDQPQKNAGAQALKNNIRGQQDAQEEQQQGEGGQAEGNTQQEQDQTQQDNGAGAEQPGTDATQAQQQQELMDVAPAEEVNLAPTAVDISTKITDCQNLDELSECRDLIRSLGRKADRDRLIKKANAREKELQGQGEEA